MQLEFKLCTLGIYIINFAGHSGTCRRIDSIMPMSQTYYAHTLWLQQVQFPSEADGYQIFQEITPL